MRAEGSLLGSALCRCDPPLHLIYLMLYLLILFVRHFPAPQRLDIFQCFPLQLCIA